MGDRWAYNRGISAGIGTGDTCTPGLQSKEMWGGGYYRNQNTRCGKEDILFKKSSHHMFLLTSQSVVIKIQFIFTNWSDVTLTCNFGWTPRHECLEFSLGIECPLLCQSLLLYSKTKLKCSYKKKNTKKGEINKWKMAALKKS